MAHVRIFNHYIHYPFLILGTLELGINALAVYAGLPTRLSIDNITVYHSVSDLLPSALVFAFTIIICMNAMGAYQAILNEGRTGMVIRTVAAFAIGSMVFPIFYYFSSDIFGVIWRSVLFFTVLYAMLFTFILRWVFYKLVNPDLFKRRALILGTGKRAKGLLADLDKPSDWQGAQLVGFFPFEGDEILVDSRRVIQTSSSLKDYVINHDIEEIVVAVDDRRKKLPLEDLMACKLEGVEIVQEHGFIEREARKVAVGVISPGWFIFSEGFRKSSFRDYLKRAFDLVAAALLLAVTWPVMLFTAFAIWKEEGFNAPLFYKQVRVGLNNEPFEVIKFRSMRVDAEKEGKAIWASKNDTRVTKVGAVIRKYRIDELPQLFNVLKGEMAFVGPRPERPVFVEKLAESIPFYNERHRVKPGITGWAQLCFDYADSEEDSKEKLRYDLYYIKNSSLLLDLLILLQTVEVVLFKKGAH